MKSALETCVSFQLEETSTPATNSTAADRIRFYLNGVERTNYTGSVENPSQNLDTFFNFNQTINNTLYWKLRNKFGSNVGDTLG